MKLPSFRRLFKGDYDIKDQPLIEKMSITINNGIEVLYNALNKNLTLVDNLLGTYKEVSLKVKSDGTPDGQAGFQVDNGVRVLGLQVLAVINNTNSTYPTSGIFVSFSQSGNLITINHITGLSTGINYTIRVFAYGGG